MADPTNKVGLIASIEVVVVVDDWCVTADCRVLVGVGWKGMSLRLTWKKCGKKNVRHKWYCLKRCDGQRKS